MYRQSAEQRRDAQVKALADQLYAERRNYLLHIARRNGANGEDAEEALQDAFVFFIERFDPASGAPPLAWLTLTLKRRCWALYRLRRRDWQQRSKRDGDYCSDAELPGGPNQHPDDLLDLAEEVVATRSRLTELKRDERRAISLLALGYSYREIGQITGWSYTKTNRCLAEGRAALRKMSTA